MAVDYQREDYERRLSKWQDVDDVIDRTNLYRFLRTLNPEDKSPENNYRNKAYREYAVFYAFSSHTLAGLTGEIFGKEPIIELPASLEYLNEDADALGNPLQHIMQGSTREVIKKGRAGLFVSHPVVEGSISRADIDNGVRATINPIDGKRIINWREEIIGGVNKLSLVVISGFKNTIGEDGFEMIRTPIWRELVLMDGVYHDREWMKIEEEWVFTDNIPLDGSGAPFEEIPFCFIGSINNDSMIDLVDMWDLAHINIGHYRNSADYEDSIWFAGQAQPWMSGVDDQHIRLLKDHHVYTGSRQLMPVPDGGSFGYASAQPNPLVRQGMVDKMETALALGARFIQQGGVAKTAAQSLSENKAATSILGVIAGNVADAYTKAIDFVGQFMAVDTEETNIQLNTEFAITGSSAQDILAKVQVWQSGGIPLADHYRNMKEVGLIDPGKTFQEFSDELEQNAERI